MKSNTRSKQKGVTLLSLIISMAIGLFLMGTVLKIYIDSKTSFNMRNLVSEVSENHRFALDDMRRILVMAGREIRAIEDQFPNRRPFPPVGNGGIVDGGPNSDTIAVRYRRGPSCGSYQNVPLTNRPTMVRFYVADNANDGTADDLVCEMTTYAAGGAANVTTRTLVSGIHMLKVLYGVDDDADGYANRYLTASQIEQPAIVPPPTGGATPWAKVVSMRIALLTGSLEELPRNYRENNAPNLRLLGFATQAPDGDHLYRVATTTLALRNLHPTIQRQ